MAKKVWRVQVDPARVDDPVIEFFAGETVEGEVQEDVRNPYRIRLSELPSDQRAAFNAMIAISNLDTIVAARPPEPSPEPPEEP